MLALPQDLRVESSTSPLFILINGTTILAGLLIGYVTLSKSLNFSTPRFLLM